MRIVKKDKNLQLLSDGSTIYEGDALPEGLTVTKTRKGQKCEVEWYKITSNHILAKTVIKCSHIPIFPVIGNETYVDGKAVRSGMVRNSKDPQRLLNVLGSNKIELISLSPKAPYLGYAGQFKDPKWQDTNIKSFAYLEAEPTDINGERAPLPQRQQFASVPTGIVQAEQQANQDIRETVGMYNASLGANSSETSGRAILAKQKEGDTGTFHYTDNLSRAIRHLGKCLVEMIPYYFDAQRIARTLGEDGSTNEIIVNPDNPKAVSKIRDNAGKIKKVFNPNIGKYDVTVTVGPSYASQRAEAAESQLELAKVIPTIAQVAPDLIARSFDFKGADEIADRLKATLPPGIAKDDEDSEPLPPQAQQAIQQAQQAMQTAQQHEQMLQQAQEQFQQQAQQQAQQMAEKEAQLKDMQMNIEMAASKLQAQQTVFNAMQKVAAIEQSNNENGLQSSIEKAQQEQAAMMKEQEIAQIQDYTKQLEAMVHDLSDVVEKTSEEKDSEPQEESQVAKSLALQTEILQQLIKPKHKKAIATKNADGSYTMESIEE